MISKLLGKSLDVFAYFSTHATLLRHLCFFVEAWCCFVIQSSQDREHFLYEPQVQDVAANAYLSLADGKSRTSRIVNLVP